MHEVLHTCRVKDFPVFSSLTQRQRVLSCTENNGKIFRRIQAQLRLPKSCFPKRKFSDVEIAKILGRNFKRNSAGTRRIFKGQIRVTLERNFFFSTPLKPSIFSEHTSQTQSTQQSLRFERNFQRTADGRIWALGSKNLSQCHLQFPGVKVHLPVVLQGHFDSMPSHLHVEPLQAGNSKSPNRAIADKQGLLPWTGVNQHCYMMSGYRSEPAQICLKHTTDTYLWFHL